MMLPNLRMRSLDDNLARHVQLRALRVEVQIFDTDLQR